MRCQTCRRADLRDTPLLFERVSDDGTTEQMVVNGFECPRCGDVVLRGRDAERLSAEWYLVGCSETEPSGSDPTRTDVGLRHTFARTPLIDSLISPVLST